MELEYYQIDAFTDTVFKGNYAGVIITAVWLSDELMQAIAMENNLSETAFVVEQDGVHHIRWFSPLTEIAFCGHATLASAFVLFQQQAELHEVTFYAGAVGHLPVRRADNDYIAMVFPNRAPSVLAEIPAALLDGLHEKPIAVLRNEQAYFAVYSNESSVHNMAPDLEALKTLAPFDVVVTAPSDEGKDYAFASRYFWPANGSDEDPVTGSIHTGLVPYWAEKLGLTDLVALQASSRSGLLRCKYQGDTVEIAGKAVQYLHGTITV